MLPVDNAHVAPDGAEGPHLGIGEVAAAANVGTPAYAGPGQQHVVLYGVVALEAGTAVDIGLVRYTRMVGQAVVKLHEKHDDAAGQAG